MSTLREILYDAITGDATVAALIGTRCYPDRLPENATFPAVVYVARVSSDDSDYRSHDAGTAIARAVSRAQLSAYAETGDEADELATALELLWSSYQDGCTVGYAQVVGWVDTVETAVNRFRDIVDVEIEHARA